MSAVVLLVLRILAAVCLYIFLALFVATLWRDINREEQKSVDIQKNRISLNDIYSKEIWEMQENEFFIGRDPLAQIRIEDDASISNMHVRIFQKRGDWWIEDLQSTNGTLLNGIRIASPETIISGDQITCGRTTLEVI